MEACRIVGFDLRDWRLLFQYALMRLLKCICAAGKQFPIYRNNFPQIAAELLDMQRVVPSLYHYTYNSVLVSVCLSMNAYLSAFSSLWQPLSILHLVNWPRLRHKHNQRITVLALVLYHIEAHSLILRTPIHLGCARVRAHRNRPTSAHKKAWSAHRWMPSADRHLQRTLSSWNGCCMNMNNI